MLVSNLTLPRAQGPLSSPKYKQRWHYLIVILVVLYFFFCLELYNVDVTNTVTLLLQCNTIKQPTGQQTYVARTDLTCEQIEQIMTKQVLVKIIIDTCLHECISVS